MYNSFNVDLLYKANTMFFTEYQNIRDRPFNYFFLSQNYLMFNAPWQKNLFNLFLNFVHVSMGQIVNNLIFFTSHQERFIFSTGRGYETEALCLHFAGYCYKTNETEQTHYTSRSCDIIHVRLLIQLPCLGPGCTYHFGYGKYCIHLSF